MHSYHDKKSNYNRVVRVWLGYTVMHTKQELMQAFNDFNEGKFSYLED